MNEARKLKRLEILKKIQDFEAKYENVDIKDIPKKDAEVKKLRQMIGADEPRKVAKKKKKPVKHNLTASEIRKRNNQAEKMLIEGFSHKTIRLKLDIPDRAIQNIVLEKEIKTRSRFKTMFRSDIDTKPDVYLSNDGGYYSTFGTTSEKRWKAMGYRKVRLSFPVLWREIPDGSVYTTGTKAEAYIKNNLKDYEKTAITKEVIAEIRILTK